MATLADLEAQLATLRKHRANGIRSVEYAGHRVEYKTDSEMAAAIADVERQIAALQGGRVTTVLIHSSKGL